MVKQFGIYAGALAISNLLVAGLANAIDLQETFDPIGPTVHQLQTEEGATLHYIDEGEEGWHPVLFFGGAGTSVYVFSITEFLRTLRTDLKLRVISVERSGLGQTAMSKGWTYDDYAAEVEKVVDHLGLDKFAMIAISGGGPYLTATAARLPDRVKFVHLVAAFSQFDPDNPDTMGFCNLEESERNDYLTTYAANPMQWWELGENSPTEKVPGFSDASFNDGARAFSIAGQKSNSTALIAEFDRYCTSKLPDVSKVPAPVYVYLGEQDTLVKPLHAEFWQNHYPNVVKVRRYADGGHDFQYRHWDQILIDMAGMADQIVVCKDGQSQLVDESSVTEETVLGICAWTKE